MLNSKQTKKTLFWFVMPLLVLLMAFTGIGFINTSKGSVNADAILRAVTTPGGTAYVGATLNSGTATELTTSATTAYFWGTSEIGYEISEINIGGSDTNITFSSGASGNVEGCCDYVIGGTKTSPTVTINNFRRDVTVVFYYGYTNYTISASSSSTSLGTAYVSSSTPSGTASSVSANIGGQYAVFGTAGADEICFTRKLTQYTLTANGTTHTITPGANNTISGVCTYVATNDVYNPILYLTEVKCDISVLLTYANETFTLSVASNNSSLGTSKVGTSSSAVTSESVSVNADNSYYLTATPATDYKVSKMIITFTGTNKTTGSGYSGTYETSFSNAEVSTTYKPISGTNVPTFAISRSTWGGALNVTATKISGNVAVTFVYDQLNFNLADGTAVVLMDGTLSYSATYTGSAITPTITVSYANQTLTEGTHYSKAFSNNTNAGEATVTITGLAAGFYYGTVTKTFPIYPKNIAGADITVSGINTAYEYTGSQIAPTITVQDTVRNVTLTAGTDYTVTYDKNVNAGTGAGVVYINGKGNYANSTLTKTFNITQVSISNPASYKVNGTLDSTYTGFAVKPTPESIEVRGFTLTNADYNLSYSNNTNAGTATMTVSAKANGNFTGSFTINYTIAKANISNVEVQNLLSDYTYTGSAINPSGLELYLGSFKLTVTTDYTISYGANTLVSTGGSVTVTAGNGGNFEGSKTITFTISQQSMLNVDIPEVSGTYTYNGTAQTPVLAITYNGKALVSGTDFTYTYLNNTNAGKATITITGLTNFNQSATREFTIAPKTITSASVTIDAIPSKVYSGNEITPYDDVAKSVKDSAIGSGTTLVQGVDYNVAFSNNVNAGNAQIVVTGTGNYIGTRPTVYFTITPFDLETNATEIRLEGVAQTYGYTGLKIAPTPTAILITSSIDSSTHQLKAGDYTLTYGTNTDIGATAYLQVNGTGNYKGAYKQLFAITQKNLNDGITITYDTTGYTYNRAEQVVKNLLVKNGVIELVEGQDYQIEYGQRINAGEGVFSVNGMGNYTGSLSRAFTISPLAVNPSLTLVCGTDVMAGEMTKTYKADGSPYSVDVRLYDSGGSLVEPGINYTVTRTRGSVVTDDLTNAGTVVFTAVASGNFTGSATARFIISPLALDASSAFVDAINAPTYTGYQLTPNFTVRYRSTNEVITSSYYTHAYSNNINATSNNAKIIVTFQGNYSGSIEKSFSILAKSISHSTITIGELDRDYYYNGTPQQPKPEVRDESRDTTLIENQDFDYSHTNNINAGLANIIITGKGNYTGTQSTVFRIQQLTITEDMVAPIANQTYTGMAIKPLPVVTHVINNTSVTLVNETHYTLNHSNNLNVTTNESKATVTVSGKGDYVGSVTVEFTILPYDIKNVVTSTIPDQPFQNKLLEPEFELTLNNKALTEGSGNDYTAVYSNNFNAGTATVTITAEGNFSGTRTLTFQITKIDISGTLVTANIIEKNSDPYNAYPYLGNAASKIYPYTGSPINPAFSVQYHVGGTAVELQNNADFTYQYQNNVEAGTSTNPFAKIVITGTRNYTGECTINYTIEPKNITDDSTFVFNAIADQPYTGAAREPAFSASYMGKIYNNETEGVWASVNYSNNIDKGIGEITIVGTNNFTGTKTLYFKIVIATLNDAELTLEYYSTTYNTQAQIPTTTVTIFGGELQLGADYLLNIYAKTDTTYSTPLAAPTNVGTYVAVVTPSVDNGNFTGQKVAEYTIEACNLGEENGVLASIVNSVKNYTGSTIHLTADDVEVSYLTVPLVYDVDFTFAYPNEPQIAGNYEVLITGIGNYTGNVSRWFSIVSESLDSVSLSASNITYGDSSVEPTITVLSNGAEVSAANYDKVWTREGATTTDFLTAGTLKLTITGKNNYMGTVTTNYVIAPRNINELEFTYQNSWVYTGYEITPEITVKYGTRTLNENTDYFVTYTYNINVGTNTGTIQITGTGNYKNTALKKFSITPHSAEDLAIRLDSAASTTYTGSQVTPNFSVYFNGTTLLTLDTDYTVAYGTNINAGTNAGSITITGKGNFEGTKSINFTINSRSITSGIIIENISDQTYTGSQITPTPVLIDNMDNGKTLQEGTDYSYTYGTNVNASTMGGSIIITGKGNYNDNVTINFNIVARAITDSAISIEVDDGATIYTGYDIEAPVNIKFTFNSRTVNLINGTDFIVIYQNNTKASDSAVAIVQGIGNFGGQTTELYWTIAKRNLNDAAITFEAIADQTYTGAGLTPNLTIVHKFGSMPNRNLTNTIDYSTSFANNTNITAGGTQASVTVTGQGNYEGTKTVNFNILPRALSLATLNFSSVVYDMLPHTVEKSNLTVVSDGAISSVEVTYQITEYQRLNQGNWSTTTDYTSVGKLRVIVNGTNNFTGSTYAEYEITQKALADSDISLKLYYLTGAGIKTYFTSLSYPGQQAYVELRRYYSSESATKLESQGVTTYLDNGNKYIVLAENSNYLTTFSREDTTSTSPDFYNKAGTMSVRCEGINNYASSIATTYNILPQTIDEFNGSLVVTFVDCEGLDNGVPYYTYKNADIIPQIKITTTSGTELFEDTDYEITTYVNNRNIGIATLTINGINNFDGRLTQNYLIVQKDINDQEISITTQPAPNYIYTGKQITPEIVMEATFENPLVLGKDYTIEYGTNLNHGIGTVTITGKGNYTGTKTLSFNINKKPLNDSDIVVTGLQESYIYTGKAIEPSFQLTYHSVIGEDTYKIILLNGENFDYTFEYTNNTTYGTAVIVVTATADSNYSGAKNIDFKIANIPLGYMIVSNPSVIFTSEPFDIECSVISAQGQAVDASEYDLTYYLATTDINGNFVYSGISTPYASIDRTNYGQIKIVASAKTTGNFSGQTEGYFTINKRSLNDTNVSLTGISNYTTYTGLDINFPIEMELFNSYALTENTDYEILYEDNVNIGQATITITGINNFKDVIVKHFSINKLNIDSIPEENLVFNQILDAEYTGDEIEQLTHSVTFIPKGQQENSILLVKDVDYKVTYESNINVGTANMHFEFINNITGKITKTFRINEKSLSNAVITLDTNTYTYDGSAKSPTPTVVVDEITLIKDKDYTISYANNIDAKTSTDYNPPTVTITGRGNYKDTAFTTFTIDPKNIADITISVGNLLSHTYTGAEIRPTDITVTDSAPTVTVPLLSYGKDYDLTYENNTNVGQAIIHINGTTNYTGTKDVNFEITTLTITNENIYVAGLNDSYSFIGSQIAPVPTQITVTNNDGVPVTLISTTDYTLTYGVNLDAGSTGRVFINGVGNFAGTVEKNFAINNRSIEVVDIAWDTSTPYTYTGTNIELNNLTITDGVMTLEKGVDYTVAYLNNINVGQATVIITGMGNYDDQSKTYAYFDIVKLGVAPELMLNQVGSSVSTNYLTINYTGSKISVEATVFDIHGKAVPAEYFDISITRNGTPESEFVKIGTIQYTYVAKQDSNYIGTAVGYFEITAIDISDEVVFSNLTTTPVYTGYEITPTFTLYWNGNVVPQDSYIGTYVNNINANQDTYYAVTFIGNFAGYATKPFTIAPKELDTSITFENVQTLIYNGTEQVPTYTVRDNNRGVNLLSPQDFIPTVSNNKNVSKNALLTITGQNNYTGTKELRFEILPLAVNESMIEAIPSLVYNGNEQKPKVYLTYNNVSLEEGTDYSVKYTNNIEIGIAWVTVTGMGNFTSSAQTSFTIIADDIANASVAAIANEYYNYGAELRPVVNVTANNKTLVIDVDYDVNYSNNTNAGTAVITISGKGNYTGTNIVEFTILPLDINTTSVINGIKTLTYNGHEQTQNFNITSNEYLLKANVDYLTEYTNNKNEGTAIITVTGVGNFTGSIETTFSIEKLDLAQAEIDGIIEILPIADRAYVGAPIYPVPEVKHASQQSTIDLVNEVDFTCVWIGDANIGTKTIQITGIGNYKGTIDTTFNIIKMAINKLELLDTTFVYNASAQKPSIKVYASEALLNASDYEIEIFKHINTSLEDVTATGAIDVGTYTLKVTVVNNNYSGSLEDLFTITQRDLTADGMTVTVKLDEPKKYTGSPITLTAAEVDVSLMGVALELGTDFNLTYPQQAIQAGTHEVVFVGINNFKGEVRRTFEIVSKRITKIEFSQTEGTYNRNPHTFTYSVFAENDDGTETKIYGIDGSSTNMTPFEDIDYTWTRNGTVTSDFVSAGTLRLTAKGKNNYMGSAYAEYVIHPYSVVNIDDINFAYPNDYTYDASAKEPLLSKALFNGVNLELDVDYNITWNKNINATTESNRAEIIINGKGNFAGTKYLYFDIKKRDINEAVFAISETADTTYTGSEVEPNTVITYLGTVLNYPNDYSVGYENNTNVGTATVIIVPTLTSNFSGSGSFTFNITPKNIDSALNDIVIPAQTYTGKVIMPAINVQDKVLGTLEKDTDYSISYGENTNAGQTAGLVTLNGKNNYTGTINIVFEITAKDINTTDFDITHSTDNLTYTGYQILPSVTVKLGDYTLLNNVDYIITYGENINVSTGGTFTISGINNFKNNTTISFDIARKVISNDDRTLYIEDLPSYQYTGAEITPILNFTYTFNILQPAKNLVVNTDYSVTYSDNINVGNCIITINGVGNYDGTMTTDFDITTRDITSVQLKNPNYVYNLLDFKPTVDDVNVMAEGLLGGEITYEILPNYKRQNPATNMFEDMIENDWASAGTIRTFVKGTGNFSGTLELDYIIQPKSIQGGDVSVYLYTTNIEGVRTYITEQIAPLDISNYTLVEVELRRYFSGSTLTTLQGITGVNLIEDTQNGGYYIRLNDNDYVVNATRTDGILNTNRELFYSTVGTVNFTINGITNYEGTRNITYNILPRALTDENLTVAFVNAYQETNYGDQTVYRYKYTGGQQSPKVVLTVKASGKTLVEGAENDYVIDSYANNINAGAATVTIVLKGQFSGTIQPQFVIDPLLLSEILTSGKLTVGEFSATGYTYNGMAHTPLPALTYYGTPLSSSTDDIETDDFIVRYDNNVNAGTATVYFDGVNNFSGTIAKNFTINKKALSDSNITASAIEDQTYTGKAITPSVTVSLADVDASGNPYVITLTPDLDYEIKYSNNINVSNSTYVPTITFTALSGECNYTGSFKTTFNITKRPIEYLSISQTEFTYSGTRNSFDIIVYDSENQVVPTTGQYAIYYYQGVFNGTEYTYGTHVDSINALDLTNVGKIKVEVSALPYNNVNYAGTVSDEIEILPYNINGELVNIANLASHVYYNGGYEIQQNLQIRFNEKALSSDNYEIAYSNNINVGTAEITITGKNNLTGTRIINFDILPFNFTTNPTALIIEQVNNYTYNRTEIKQQAMVLKYHQEDQQDVVLVEDQDYKLTYSNNTNVGKAHIDIEFINNYEGLAAQDFDILRASISAAEFTISPEEFIYDSSAKIPEKIEIVLDNYLLAYNEDYTLTFESNVNAGTATVVATGKNNYTESVKKTYTITKRDISTVNIENVVDKIYTGSAITQTPLVYFLRDNGAQTVLAVGKDFEISYTDNINAGEVTLSVIAKEDSNYSGSKEITFNINPLDIAHNTVKVDSIANKTFTTKEIRPTADTGDVILTNNGLVIDKSDYILTYVNNINVGTATINIEGQNNYFGTISVNFEIVPKSLTDLNTPTVILYEFTGTKTYTGSAIELTHTNYEQNDSVNWNKNDFKLTYNSVYLLIGTDFTVEYENNTNASITENAVITIKGKDNYKDELSFEWRIVQKELTAEMITVLSEVESETPQWTFTGSQITPGIVVYDADRDVTLDLNIDYTVGYGENLNYGEGTVDVYTPANSNYIVSNPPVTKTFNIVQKLITSVVLEKTNFDYTGSEIVPSLKVYTSGTSTALIQDQDYTVTIAENSNINAAENIEIIVNGINNYQGEIIETFNINPRSLKDGKISVAKDIENAVTYSGWAYTPIPTITFTPSDGATPINLVYKNDIHNENEAPKDFTLEYKDNLNAGIAVVTITGIGNYKDILERTFLIQKYTITDDMIYDFDEKVVFTNEPIVQDFKILHAGKPVQELVLDTDYYVIALSQNKDVGTVIIQIVGQGNYICKIIKQFEIIPQTMNKSNTNIAGIESEVVYNGLPYNTFPIVVSFMEDETTLRELTIGKDYDVTYPTDTTNAGTKTIKFTFKGNYQGNLEQNYEIKPKELTEDMVSQPDDQVYTGLPITPPISVYYDGMELVEDRDYLVSYKANTNLGMASIVVDATLNGNYTGRVTKYFQITQKIITDLSEFNYDPIDTYVYTGRAITPDLPVLTFKEDGRELKARVNYDVDWVNNIDALQGSSIRLTFKGGYTGVVLVPFTINPADVNEMEFEPIKDTVYNGKEQALIPVARFDVFTPQINVGFIVKYPDDITSANEIVLTIEGIGNFTGVYTANEVKYNILQADINSYINVTFENGFDYSYTGSPIEPPVYLEFHEFTLNNSNFDIVYENNVNKGPDASVTISANPEKNNNFTGSKQVKFEIVSKSLHVGLALPIADVEYNGTALTPQLILQDGNYTLQEGVDKDYTISYINNTNAGIATIIVTGSHNYIGAMNINFNIIPRTLGTDGIPSINLFINPNPIPDQPFTNAEIHPEFALSYLNDNLFDSTDFEVSYANNIAVSNNASFTVTGIGNYKGTATYKFSIVPCPISEVEVSELMEYYYSGSPVEPELVLIREGTMLELNTDYTAAYFNNIGASKGLASIVITGKGNYIGSRTIIFDILPLEITDVVLPVSTAMYDMMEKLSYIQKVDVYCGAHLVDQQYYRIEYMRNGERTIDFVNAGTISVKVTAGINYTGTISKDFVIAPKSLSDPDIYVSNTIRDFSYTGQPITQKFDIYQTMGINVITLAEQTEEISGDYTVSYGANNTDVGLVVITIAGVNNYTGFIERTFNITKITPTVNPYYDGKTLFAGDAAPLLKLSEGDTPGTITLLETVLVAGTKAYEWLFIPENQNNYYSLNGTIRLIAQEVRIIDVEVVTQPLKTTYLAFEYFEDEGLSLNAIYNNGKIEPISTYEIKDNTWLNTKITKMTISCVGLTIDIPITVQPREISITFANYQNLLESDTKRYVSHTIDGEIDGYPIDATLQYTHNGEIVDSITGGGRYVVSALLPASTNYVFTNNNFVEFDVKFIRLYSENVTAIDPEGFDVGAILQVTKITDAVQMKEYIGELKVVPDAIYIVTLTDANGNKIELNRNIKIRITNNDPNRENLSIYTKTDDSTTFNMQTFEIGDGYLEISTDQLAEYTIGLRIVVNDFLAISWWWILIILVAIAIMIEFIILFSKRTKQRNIRGKKSKSKK